MERRHQFLLESLRKDQTSKAKPWDTVSVVLEGDTEPKAYHVHYGLKANGEVFAHDAGKPGCSCKTLDDETTAALAVLESTLRDRRRRLH